MSYNPATDFLALSRATASGQVLAKAPGLDIVVDALSRAGLFELSTGQTAPVVNQAKTVWLKPSQPSWTAEGVVWLWDAESSQYVQATPELWTALLAPNDGSAPVLPSYVFETVAAAQAAVVPAPQLSFFVIRHAAGFPAEQATYIPGASGGPGAFTDAGGRTWQLDLSASLHYASWYGVNGDNADYTAPLQKAVSFSGGREVRLPFGTIVITAPINYTTTVQGAFGLRLSGAGGAGQTVIDSRIAGGPAAALIVHGAPSAFAYSATVRGIKFITTAASPVTFMDILANYSMLIEDCSFVGSRGNGVNITSNLGDPDASNTIVFNRCFFTANGGAGLLSNNAPAVVQTTFVRCENCFFSENTLTGWYNVGLSSYMSNCGFTENGNGGIGGGLYVANNAGSNAQFTAIGCSFENNYVFSASLNALVGAQFINCEIAGGTPPIVAVSGFIFNGSTKIRCEGTRVRVAAFENPHVAFRFINSPDNVISNTQWQTYDNPGQTRFVLDAGSYGNRLDDSFDAKQEGQDSGVMSIAFVNGANQNVAAPLTGHSFTISGPTGVFNVGGLTNGFPGRRLRLVNNTAFTLTLNNEDAGSTAANRIWCGAGGKTVLAQSGVTLEYNSQVSRWVAG